MSTGEIRIDPERLRSVATSVRSAHDTLAATPRYSNLHAGDHRGRLADAVDDFIRKNEGPREELIQQLLIAAEMLDAAWEGYSKVESCLVRALAPEGN